MLNIRFATPEEARPHLEANASRNAFDPKILDYPRLVIVCVYDGDQPIAYVPIHMVAMVESVGFTPDATQAQRNGSMRLALQAINFLANSDKLKEVYFVGSDDNTNEASKLVGFNKLESPVFRSQL